MLMTLLLAATLAFDTPRVDARPGCAPRQLQTPAGKINHAAAMTCTPTKVKAVRETRVVTPRKKV